MVEIAVHGEASRSVDAEVATVRLVVETHADDRGSALRACAAAQRALVAALEALVVDGSVARWSSTRVMTFVDWHQEKGEVQARSSQAAQASVRAEFSDLGAVGDWLTQVGEDEAVRIEEVAWSVTEATRVAVERELRVEAVTEAMRRARDYADALGAGGIEVVALFEPGLRAQAPSSPGLARQSRIHAFSGTTSGGFDLRADPIELSAQISLDARAGLT